MPILIAIIAAIGGAIWLWARNNPRDAIDTAIDVAQTAKNAPRRFAFRRQTNQHPVEAIDDPETAICALLQGFLELEALPTADQRKVLHRLIRAQWRLSEEEAVEMEAHGRWLISECGSPAQAMSRLGRRLKKIDDDHSWHVLQDMLPQLVEGELSHAQTQAVTDLGLIFRA